MIISEGEKDVDRLRSLGLVATCNVGGAGKWTKPLCSHFQNRRVFILPDNDDSGGEHANKVAAMLSPAAENVKIVELPGLPAKGDVRDWLDDGGTIEQLRAFAATLLACSHAGVQLHGHFQHLVSQ